MSAVGENEPSLAIPERRRPPGPMALRRLRVTAAGLCAVWLLGILPIVAGWGPSWKAFGLGLLFPGGGFLYTSDVPLFLLILPVALYIAIFQFQFRADHVSPIGLVLAAAGGAALRAHTGPWDWPQWVLPAIMPAAWVTFRVGRRRAFHRAQTRRTQRNRYLVHLRAGTPNDTLSVGPALSDEDLGVARWLLDRALQSKDRFDGFEWSTEQFSMASMRYQLNWMQWSLALLNYTRTPAFSGYLTVAQRNLIDRMTHRRVWRYWRLENLWGNLDPNPDPIRRDNIMFSGYLGLMLGMYTATTGDRSFDEPGSLTFRWNERRSFAYDHPAIMDVMLRSYRETPWGLFPCEPGLNFAGCNAIGVLGVQLWDRIAGTEHSPEIVRVMRRTLDEEFAAADGDVVNIISRRLGYSLRFVRSAAAQAGQALFARSFASDLADRTWAVLKREVIEIDADGLLNPRKYAEGGGRYDAMDLGSKKPSPVFLLATLSALAREIGDEDVYRAAVAKADATLTPSTEGGSRWYGDVSVYANATMALARFGWKDAWVNLMTKGLPEPARTGPRLAAAPYPDVLVARAVTDGKALDAVLVPGGAGGRQTLFFDRLAPGRTYRVVGGAEPQITAAHDGTAAVAIDLDRRTGIQVTPLE